MSAWDLRGTSQRWYHLCCGIIRWICNIVKQNSFGRVWSATCGASCPDSIFSKFLPASASAQTLPGPGPSRKAPNVAMSINNVNSHSNNEMPSLLCVHDLVVGTCGLEPTNDSIKEGADCCYASYTSSLRAVLELHPLELNSVAL